MRRIISTTIVGLGLVGTVGCPAEKPPLPPPTPNPPVNEQPATDPAATGSQTDPAATDSPPPAGQNNQ